MKPRAERTRALPSPSVRFEPDFLARVERLLVRLAGARERREGSGRSFLLGGGSEFSGHRPYRPGEDLRALDWSLLARLDKPFVRISKREAGERWAVLVDASASMGVGTPGKLQRAAEVAGALACLGLRERASVQLLVAGGAPTPRRLELRRRGDPAPMIAFLEGLEASGSNGLGTLLAAPPRIDAARVFIVGDLLDVEPEALLVLARRGRGIAALQLLAPCELAPELRGAVEWWDPEAGATLRVELDERTLTDYERRLEARLAGWRALAARHGFGYACRSTETPFEDVVRSLARGEG